MSYHWGGILILFHIVTLRAWAQVDTEFPVQHGQYYLLQSASNPSASGLFGHTESFANTYANLGAFKNIRTVSFLINQRLGQTRDSNYHTIGLYFTNDQEGDFLHRNRGYLSYSYHLSLSNTYHLSTGASLGFASLSAQGTTTTPGGSDIVMDGHVGFTLYSKRFNIGISSGQLFNEVLKPIRQEIVLKRYYQLFIKRTFALTPYVNFVPMVQLRYPSFPNRYDLDLTALFQLQDMVWAGISYKVQQQVSATIGIDVPVINNHHLSIFFTYHTAAFSSPSRAQALEFSLGYLLK